MLAYNQICSLEHILRSVFYITPLNLQNYIINLHNRIFLVHSIKQFIKLRQETTTSMLVASKYFVDYLMFIFG